MTARFDTQDPFLTKAFAQVKPELEAIPAERILPIRHDITAAIVLALGIVPKVKSLRPLVVAKFGEAAGLFMDRLETDANACSYAHACHLTTLRGTDVEELVGQLTQVRSVLSFEVQALIARGVVGSPAIGELVGGTSYRGLYSDVVQLVAVMRTHWAAAEAMTGVTPGELDRAEALATAFSAVLGENEQGVPSSPTADMRRRAYTRLVETYSEIRRQAIFLRWETDDADSFAPALGSNRATRTERGDDEIPVPVVPTNGTPIAPGMPGAPALGPIG